MKSERIEITADGQWQVEPTATPRALLPGSFNPVHEGHWGLAEAARLFLGENVAFELSRTNVDKPGLDDAEIRRRAAQFAGLGPLWVTRAPTFVAKAALFAGAVFVVGADTALRIVSLRYHGESEKVLKLALAHIRERNCRFLVGGRVDASGQFVRLRDLPIPDDFRDLFDEIPAEAFRCDVSSTALRTLGKTP